MNRPGCRWRLIVDGPASGEWNMAVDRAILASHAAGDGPPTLRLYRWSPPAVSLGRFQSTDDVDMAYCAAEGLDVCRRPTGGRGVLHDDELTYSIVAGVADGLPRGVRRSYTICRLERRSCQGVPRCGAATAACSTGRSSSTVT
jgi:lipoate-protein ligase A